MADEAPKPPAFTHRWRLRRVLPQYFGKLCRIVPKEMGPGNKFARGYYGAMGQPWTKVTVEFQDGTMVECARAAIRPITYSRVMQTGRKAGS
jgi:hypothetical protein